MSAPGGRPPLPIRAIGRGMSALVARAPFLWPLLRGPTRRFWDRAAASWDERRRPEGGGHLAPLTAACDRLDSEPRRILELGTGTGVGALLLARRFPDAEVWAVDLSEAMVAAAEAKTPAELRARVHFAVADASALPHESGAFDLVSQLNLPLFARETARVLASGGHVVVASTLGSRTPYYTPDRVLRRKFERLGLEALDGGRAGDGTYFLARKP
jgi:ubiquinone/menaquinone biosynthesis C-methylase UbiE